MDNMIGLRIVCPNLQWGNLEASEGHKFFQLKSGRIVLGRGKILDSHIIGVVGNEAGDCKCWAWEEAVFSQEERITDRGRLELAKKEFINVQEIGPGYCPTDIRYKCFTLVKPPQLIHFRDNVRNFKYQCLGPLELYIQGLRI